MGQTRRHPADVTADRLIGHSIEWNKFSATERDAIGVVIQALQEIAEGSR